MKTPRTFPEWLHAGAETNLRHVHDDLAVGAATAPLREGFRWAAVVDFHGFDRHWKDREIELGALTTHAPVVRLPFKDCESVPFYVFELALATYRAAHDRGTVLFVCFAGRSRSASVAAAVLAVEHGIPWEEAVRRVGVYDVRGVRVAAPHPVTLGSAREWVAHHLEQRRARMAKGTLAE